jgi:hypothetical protein
MIQIGTRKKYIYKEGIPKDLFFSRQFEIDAILFEQTAGLHKLINAFETFFAT